MMRLYISGPMSGVKDLNLPAFAQVAKALRSHGHEAVSPGEFLQNTNADHGWTGPAARAQYLRKDVHELANCSAIYLMDGWQRSVGANIELHIARLLMLEVYSHYSWPDKSNAWPNMMMVRAHLNAVNSGRPEGE